MSRPLDLNDKKILYELDVNARVSASVIGKRIKLPKETVNYRINRLQSSGYINLFYTLINAASMGYLYYQVFLKFHRLTKAVEEEMVSYLKKQENCANLRITEGPFDLVFVSVHKNPRELRDFLHDFSMIFGHYVLEKNIHAVTASYKFNQKSLFPGKSVKHSFYSGATEPYSADELDKRIMRTISTDARGSLMSIARSLGSEARTVRYRIKKLEKMKIIVGYATDLDLGEMGRQAVILNICLKNPGVAQSILEFFDQTNTCLFAHEVLGLYDLSVELNVVDDSHLRKVMDQFRDRFVENYNFFDMHHVVDEHVINWAPF